MAEYHRTLGGSRAIRERIAADRAAARTVRQIVRDWRALRAGSGGGPGLTLVACSGGSDSVALAGALASATSGLVIAHVLHDLRPSAEAEGDLAVARGFAAQFGLRFVSRSIRVRDLPGNAEANARRERYRALEEMARESGCGWIATGHHADDVMETLLMGLIRGSGVRGLRGIAPSRAMVPGLVLIRPMLSVTRADAEHLCETLGLAWAEDRTNADTSRLRAALRHGVIDELNRLRPGASVRAARSAALLRGVYPLLRARAEALWDLGEPREDGRRWERAALRGEPRVVLGEFVRLASERMGRGAGLDKAGILAVERVASVMVDASGGLRTLTIGATRWEVSREMVEVFDAGKTREDRSGGALRP